MRRFVGIVALAGLAAAACVEDGPAPPTIESGPTVETASTGGTDASVATTGAPGPASTTSPTPATVPGDAPAPIVGVQPMSGNRTFGGGGGLPDGEPIDAVLPGRPAWVVGVPDRDAAGWVVALEDGRVVTVALRGGATAVTTSSLVLAPLQPPRAIGTQDGPLPVAPVHPSSSVTTQGITIGNESWYVSGDTRLWAELGAGGGLVLEGALTDTRMAVSDSKLIAALVDPTEEYRHGVLGDAVEARSIAVVDGRTAVVFPVPEGVVVEGTSPMWIDADGDGTQEILVTLSDPDAGARLALFDASGALLAEGPPVGEAFRWRHQIGAAPIGPNGEYEIVAVRTPHIDGVVEFYALEEGGLEIVAEVPGLTSHVIGSRNMDLAIVADADGDGALEVVGPARDRRSLVAARRTADGADIVWTVPLDGLMVTNLGAVDVAGTLWLAAGLRDGTLRIWPG